ncbi:MAG: MFS transporter [Kiritimatiellales bacterium]
MIKRTQVNPWKFVPTSTIFSALTWGTAQTIPGLLLKSMDFSNTAIGLTSMLGLPIAFRFIFGPFVDTHGTKRAWTLNMQGVISGVMLLLAAFCGLSLVFDMSGWIIQVLLVMFAGLALMSAFNEIGGGGFFLAAVNERDKALFVGINAACVRLANLFAMGFMVVLAGKIQKQTGQTMAGWAVCFAVFGLIQLFLMLYHRCIYPYPILDKPIEQKERKSFFRVFALFFEQRRAWVILSFVFLYRLGEGLLNWMKIPFLMDPADKGGLGMSLDQVGVMNGIFAVIAMIAGGLLGGFLVKKYGLRKTVWPFAISMTVPAAGFVWLAAHPVFTEVNLMGTSVNLWGVVVLTLEAFGYGIGFSSFGFLHCEACRGSYRATFFAMLTGVMSISWILTGSLSGIIQAQVGYVWLFILSIIFAIPGVVIIAWLPLKDFEERGEQEDAARKVSQV